MSPETTSAINSALELLSSAREEYTGVSHACTILASVLEKDQAAVRRDAREAVRHAEEPAIADARRRRLEAQAKLLEERLAAAAELRRGREARAASQAKLLEERLAAATARRIDREARAVRTAALNDYKIKYAAWLAESKLHPAPGYPNLIETNWARDNRPPVKPC